MGKPEYFRDTNVYGPRTTAPDVNITHCTGFQKFRYVGENRPGMKNQEKDFLTLSLHNLSGRRVQIQICCFDANQEMHPNGLVGRDCHDGVYTKLYHICKGIQVIRIPYLRIERVKIREMKKATEKGREEKSSAPTISSALEKRAELLPSPYKEQCTPKVRKAYCDTTRVRLGVIVTVERSTSPPLFRLSHVIQNASEKTKLGILKLSTNHVSARDGGQVHIFTTESGPFIEEGKCTVKVTVGGEKPWTSPEFKPQKEQILYKRVVTYHVPAYPADCGTTEPVEATLHLYCTESGQTDSYSFTYEASSARCSVLENISKREKKTRKRTHADSTSAPTLLSSGSHQEAGQRGWVMDEDTGNIPLNAVQPGLPSARLLCSPLSGVPQVVPALLGVPDLPPATSAPSTSAEKTAPKPLTCSADSAGPPAPKKPRVVSAVSRKEADTTSSSNQVASCQQVNVGPPAWVGTALGNNGPRESSPPLLTSGYLHQFLGDSAMMEMNVPSVSLLSNFSLNSGEVLKLLGNSAMTETSFPFVTLPSNFSLNSGEFLQLLSNSAMTETSVLPSPSHPVPV